jgi:hypothetical protein
MKPGQKHPVSFPLPSIPNPVSIELWNVDENYIPTLDIKLLEGIIPNSFRNDSSGVSSMRPLNLWRKIC